jgi:hypothetical protein
MDPELYLPVLEFFENNHNKAMLWFHTENPMLGNVKPYDMIILGKKARLLKFIQAQLEENNND